MPERLPPLFHANDNESPSYEAAVKKQAREQEQALRMKAATRLHAILTPITERVEKGIYLQLAVYYVVENKNAGEYQNALMLKKLLPKEAAYGSNHDEIHLFENIKLLYEELRTAIKEGKEKDLKPLEDTIYALALKIEKKQP